MQAHSTLSAPVLLALCGGPCLLAACATPKPTTLGASDFGAAERGEISGSCLETEKGAPRSPATWEELESRSSARGTRSNIIEFAFGIYTNHITKIDGARCEHRPTCSRYSLEAIRAHGFVVGSWLTLDRLMRASKSSTLRTLPLYKFEEGKPYFRDPVEENDFFF